MSTTRYTINKIYFPISDKDRFVKNFDQYFNSLPIVYKTSTFVYEDLVYFNVQLDFKTGELSKEDFHTIMNNFNKNSRRYIVEKTYYKYKKDIIDIKVTYKINTE